MSCCQGIEFCYSSWSTRFPGFSVPPTVVASELASEYFEEARMMLDVCAWQMKPERAKLLLNLLTAHIAQLYSGYNGNLPSGVVGRISQASEGTVSLSAEYAAPMGASWYLQTPFGAQFWEMTANLRSFRYVPKAGRFTNMNGFGPTYYRGRITR